MVSGLDVSPVSATQAATHSASRKFGIHIIKLSRMGTILARKIVSRTEELYHSQIILNLFQKKKINSEFRII
jgi:hypothetical protein